MLDEHDLDATVIIGSGKEGRITKSDVLGYLKSHSDENVTPGDPAPELEIGAAYRLVRRVRNSGCR